ncbi:MAG: hypothetical protein ABIZ82_10760 [Candidatus Tumulicola sp.]
MKHWIAVAFGSAVMVMAISAAPLVSAAAPAPAPTPVALAKPDFSAQMWMVGSWSCTQPLRGKTRPETDVNSIGMDGMWMVTQTTAPPFDEYRTTTINGIGYTGYDPVAKLWIQTGVDNGGGYGIQTSPGWQANMITWTGKNPDGSSSTDVITKVSDTETSDANTATDPQGNTTSRTIRCVKSS